MKPDRQDQELGFGMNLAFLNGPLKSPLHPPFSKGGWRGDFCRCLAQKEDVEKYGGSFQKAKALRVLHI
jgi:hypothetical protein